MTNEASTRLAPRASHLTGSRNARRPGTSQDQVQISCATWLVDDGVPPNMVQRVMGHERSSTTLDLYTRRTDNSSRILDALNDPDEVPDDEDPDDGSEPANAPV